MEQEDKQTLRQRNRIIRKQNRKKKMNTDDRLENVGGIRGRAYVMFGGKVALGTFNDGERFGGIAFAELLDKKNVGDDISSKEHYEAQVYIDVKSLESLQALRDVLDMCESQLKDQIEKDRANTETKQ